MKNRDINDVNEFCNTLVISDLLYCSMLTSKYIGPLREEAASWAEKLKEVQDVLEIWLEVQDLWQYLEEVFSNPTASKVCKGAFYGKTRFVGKSLHISYNISSHFVTTLRHLLRV